MVIQVGMGLLLGPALAMVIGVSPASWASTPSDPTVGQTATESAAAAAKLAKGESQPVGSLQQLDGAAGCVVDKSVKRKNGCAPVRALKSPGPFMGSRAIQLSPNGKHVYVASSKSDAVAVFQRNKRTGVLKQPKGAKGCVAAKGAQGCGKAIGVDGPNSIALSPDGRNVYVTSRSSSSLTTFRRNNATGALTQLPGAAGCVAGSSVPGCAAGVALVGPDVVEVSPDGKNVYIGSFLGNAVASFSRSNANGALTQLSGTAACIATATDGCATGLALKAPEGMAISKDGDTVYVATALSNAVAVLNRNKSTGELTQATDGTGCVVDAPLTGCTTGNYLAGANALAFSPNGRDLYATNLISNTLTSFNHYSSGDIGQKNSISGCLADRGSANCRYARAMASPEGADVSPDGRNVYVTAYATGAVTVLHRNKKNGTVTQLDGRAACVAGPVVPDCTKGRALEGVSSVVVSDDGRHVYTTSAGSDAVNIFDRKR